MFRTGEFNFTERICDCETQDIAWNIPLDNEGQIMLAVWCNNCNTKVVTPSSKFKASICFDDPYPKQKTEKLPGKLLKLVFNADKKD